MKRSTFDSATVQIRNRCVQCQQHEENKSPMNSIFQTLKLKSKLILLFMLLLTIQTQFVFSQKHTNKAEYVSFTLTHSMRIPYNYIRIEFTKSDSVFYLTVNSKALDNNRKFKSTTFLKHYKSDMKTFNRLVTKLKKLEEVDLKKALPLGRRDGTSCTISFGTRERTISYNCWSPDYETKERGLIEYYNICVELIKLAKLKTEDIL